MTLTIVMAAGSGNWDRYRDPIMTALALRRPFSLRRSAALRR